MADRKWCYGKIYIYGLGLIILTAENEYPNINLYDIRQYVVHT